MLKQRKTSEDEFAEKVAREKKDNSGHTQNESPVSKAEAAAEGEVK